MTARRAAPQLRLSAVVAALLLVAATRPDRAADNPPPVPVPLIETSRSELVLIEVYARDRKGNPVRDLKLSDFTLRIDHKPLTEPVNSLDWIEAPPAPAGTPTPAGQVAGLDGETGASAKAPESAPPAATPGTPPAAATPGAGELPAHRDRPRRFLLFFEDSTSSPTQMTEARRAAIAFLERPGLATDQFGIASYSEKRKLEILQEFTTDRALLRQVLEKSVTDSGRWTDYSAERLARQEEIRRARIGASQSGIGAGASQVDGMARTYATEDSSRMGRVLNIMKLLVDAMAPWPGYKSIVFIGEGVPQNPAEDYNLNDPRLAITSELSGLSFAAGGANVTLNSIQVTGLTAGDARQVGASLRRSSALANLALDTGGVSLTSNDLTGAFTAVEESSAGYYLLTYAPQSPPDGNYHTVALKVARGGVTIRYRRGFVRYTPEAAKVRAIQAAYVAPEMHGEMGLDLAVVAGPRVGDERVFDLVLYVPPRRLLFLPQAGGPAARLEIGLVGIEAGGGAETFRLARRIRVAPESVALADAARSGFDFFTRVRLPDRAQTITAVISDLQSGDLGSVRVSVPAPADTAGGAQGLSLYALREKSLWIEIAEASGKPGAGKPAPAGPEVDAGVTVGPALRTRFAPGETIACGFRPGAGATGGGTADAPAEVRLVVRLGDEVVRSLPFAAPSVGSAGGGTLHADLTTGSLADGDYVATVETTNAGVTSEIGRMPFRIRPRGRL